MIAIPPKYLLAGALLVAAASVGGSIAWWVQGTKLTALQASWDKAKQDQRNTDAATNATHRTTETTNADKVIKELNEANARIAVLQADATTARREYVRLHNTLTEFRSSVPTLSAEALGNYASALSTVFGECSERYSTVAESAGGHASDSLTYDRSWPAPAP